MRVALPIVAHAPRLTHKSCACCSAKIVAFSALCDFDVTAGATTVLAVLSGSSLQLFSCRVYVLFCVGIILSPCCLLLTCGYGWRFMTSGAAVELSTQFMASTGVPVSAIAGLRWHHELPLLAVRCCGFGGAG